MRFFISIVLLVFSVKVVAQKQRSIDSLLIELKKSKDDTTKIKNLNFLAIAYLKSDSTKGLNYGRNALQLSKKINWKKGIANSHYAIGAHYGENFLTQKAFYHYNQALVNSTDKLLLGNVYLVMGQSYLHQSRYKEALKAFHTSLKLYENINNNKGIIKVSTYLGSLYSGIQNPEKALSYYNRALQLCNQIKDDSYIYGITRGIGIIYSDQSNYKKSIEYLEKSYSYSLKSNDLTSQANVLSDIALVYLNDEQYTKAILYSKRSLEIQKKLPIGKMNFAFCYGVIGDAYTKMAKKDKRNTAFLDSAITNLNQSIQLNKEVNNLRSLFDDYSSLTEAQKLMGNHQLALQSYETAIAYKDSIYNSDNKETIQNLEDKREIELRDKEIKINNLKLEAKEKQKWYLITGLILLGIIGSLLLYQNRNRKKTNEKLLSLNSKLDSKNKELDEANKIKARFFGILNHDLRSPIYNLIHFLHLQKENPELLDEEMKNSIQTKTMVSAENLLQSMEDMLLWSKGQMEHFQPQPQPIEIAQLFDDTQKYFSGVENIQFVFENTNNLTLVTDENYLKTIIRNLTGNAVKALENFDLGNRIDSRDTLGMTPTIIWRAFRENGAAVLSITDNGKGANQDQFKALYDEKEVVGIKTGLGLHLIRDLAKAIDCEILVDSKVNEGTTITLRL